MAQFPTLWATFTLTLLLAQRRRSVVVGALGRDLLNWRDLLRLRDPLRQLLLAGLVEGERPSTIQPLVPGVARLLWLNLVSASCFNNGDFSENFVHSAALEVCILSSTNRCWHLATSREATIKVWRIVV